jgi:hypothetical protein
VTELKNTLGSMVCTSKDSNNCVLDNISMTDSEDGDFAASFDDPTNLAADITEFKQKLINNNYKGG